MARAISIKVKPRARCTVKITRFTVNHNNARADASVPLPADTAPAINSDQGRNRELQYRLSIK